MGPEVNRFRQFTVEAQLTERLAQLYLSFIAASAYLGVTNWP
jgi:hypothetical protein